MVNGESPVRPQDLIFTILGTYVLPQPRPLWSGGLVALLEDFGFSTAAARMALSRFVRQGHLVRTKAGRQTFYTLSKPVARLLTEGERRILTFGIETDSPSRWTIVSYSMPEDQRAARDRLRKRLTFLGFASIHDGTWFSPRDHEADVLALLDELDLGEEVAVFLGAPSPGIDVGRMIQRGWDLARLDALYRDFAERFAPYRAPARRRRMSDREAFVVRTQIVHEFRRFPTLDPELPVRPRSARAEAVRVFHTVYPALAEPAEMYFERVAIENA